MNVSKNSNSLKIRLNLRYKWWVYIIEKMYVMDVIIGLDYNSEVLSYFNQLDESS